MGGGLVILALRTARALAAIYAVSSGFAIIALLLEPRLAQIPSGTTFLDQAIVFGLSLALVIALRRIANWLHSRVKPGEQLLTSNWRI